MFGDVQSQNKVFQSFYSTTQLYIIIYTIAIKKLCTVKLLTPLNIIIC